MWIIEKCNMVKMGNKWEKAEKVPIS